MTHILIPRTPSMNLLRPFIECPTSELDQAWAAMVRIAEVQHARVGRQCLTQIEEPAAPAAVAGPAPKGWRLVPATPTRDWIAAVADGGYEDCDCASLIADILSRAPAAPALEAPAAPALDAKAIAVDVCQRVADMDDRSSPADWPEAMLVTGPELVEIVEGEIAQAMANAVAAPIMPTALHVAARYWQWLEIMGRLTSFSTFVNEFGYEKEDCKQVYEQVVLPCFALLAAAPQAPAAPWKDHLTARLVNDLRDCAIKYHGAGQLRDRIAHIVAPLCDQLKAAQAAPAAPAVDAETIHLQDLKNALAECQELRQQLTLMDEQQAGSIWRWQADDQDQIETMGNRMGVLIYACDLRALLARAAPAVDAASDTALLDAMQRHRISLVPEFEGPWDAEIFNDEAEARPIASGNTPREALRAALAAQAKEGGA
ncbi:hypothetical protein [Delftia tsuruhatensis]|jgi:hypothetical protein|uniref:Uncharacterized protein n=1 Tax=Delftia tsuruhatensis TaxID=180282 RepID=A0AAX3SGZ7_9BURK|nr:hypothetical protein [Delftia tsuruhatensis]WFF79336.1 hypothetical protein PYR84_20620 [Delftia tsuruhatensis]